MALLTTEQHREIVALHKRHMARLARMADRLARNKASNLKYFEREVMDLLSEGGLIDEEPPDIGDTVIIIKGDETSKIGMLEAFDERADGLCLVTLGHDDEYSESRRWLGQLESLRRLRDQMGIKEASS